MRFLVLVFVLLATVSCSDKRNFKTYEHQPFSEALKLNHVNAYIQYLVEDGREVTTDSFGINRDGLITEHYYLGFMPGEFVSTYDSLNRMTEQVVSSDTYSHYFIEYELDFEKRLVRQFVYDSSSRSNLKTLAWIVVKRYNDNLDRILRESRVVGEDTVLTYEYVYDSNKIQREILYREMDTTVLKTYHYNNKKLSRIKWGTENEEYTDFISETGLIDSTVLKTKTTLTTYYYRYF